MQTKEVNGIWNETQHKYDLNIEHTVYNDLIKKAARCTPDCYKIIPIISGINRITKERAVENLALGIGFEEDKIAAIDADSIYYEGPEFLRGLYIVFFSKKDSSCHLETFYTEKPNEIKTLLNQLHSFQ